MHTCIPHFVLIPDVLSILCTHNCRASFVGGILHDIHESLVMAMDHGELPPVRILRILAGERNGMFNCDNRSTNPSLNHCGVPLSVAMDYVGAVLDDSSGKIHRLKVSISLCLHLDS